MPDTMDEAAHPPPVGHANGGSVYAPEEISGSKVFGRYGPSVMVSTFDPDDDDAAPQAPEPPPPPPLGQQPDGGSPGTGW